MKKLLFGVVLPGLLGLCACAPAVSAQKVSCTSAQPFGQPDTLRPAPPNWPNTPGDITAALPGRLQDQLNTTLDELMRVSGATGVTVAVGLDGLGHWSAVRGLAQLQPARAVQPGDLFQAASVGKMFTATLVWQDIQAGKLSLDDPLVRWFPNFPQAQHITIGQLLSHTSGVPTRATANSDGQPAPYAPPDKVIAEAATLPRAFCPGAAWSYSNTGYILLGRILEQLHGEPMAQQVAERIARPLNLQHTIFLGQDDQGRLVEGHRKGQPVGGFNYTGPFSAGSIATTAEDLLAVMHALMDGRLLDPQTLRRMGEHFYPMVGYADSLAYGYGLMRLDTPAGPVLGHTGGITGFNSIVWYEPQRGVSVAVIVNDETSAAAFALRLHQAALKWKEQP